MKCIMNPRCDQQPSSILHCVITQPWFCTHNMHSLHWAWYLSMRCQWTQHSTSLRFQTVEIMCYCDTYNIFCFYNTVWKAMIFIMFLKSSLLWKEISSQCIFGMFYVRQASISIGQQICLNLKLVKKQTFMCIPKIKIHSL